MSDETSTRLPEIEDPAGYVEQLTFRPDLPVTDLPPVLDDGDDVRVPRSFKPPLWLDDQLGRIAQGRGVSKSALICTMLESAVAAELASQQETEIMIPLADALRALTGLRHLPRSA
jgi:hypothetical protein